jgi:hypothetical protein
LEEADISIIQEELGIVGYTNQERGEEADKNVKKSNRQSLRRCGIRKI